jgi:hypothetical protein
MTVRRAKRQVNGTAQKQCRRSRQRYHDCDLTTPGSGPARRGRRGPGNGDDLARSMAVSPSENAVYVTGNSYGGTATGYDYATVAYNATTGAGLWGQALQRPGNGTDVATRSPSARTRAVGHRVQLGGTSGPDCATAAYNTATGGQLWVSTYNGPGNSAGVANSVTVSPSGNTVHDTGSSDGSTTGAGYATIAYNR